MFLVYIGITILTVVMMWPIYENFIWAQYQVIGLEERLQRAFRTIQIAKSTFLIFFLFTIIQFVNLIYFETNSNLNILYSLLGVAMLLLIRLGYIAVRSLHDQLRTEKSKMVNIFLLLAVAFTIFIYTIFGLRQLQKIDHHHSGPLNKFMNFVLSRLL